MKFIGIITAVIFTTVVSAIWSGYVFNILWAWFIMDIFKLPSLSTPLAIGIMLVIKFATYQYSYTEAEEGEREKKLIAVIWFSMMYPAISLLMGWIILKFI